MATAAQVLAECLQRPGHTSIWSVAQNKYVCSKDPAYHAALADQSADVVRDFPPINAKFKLVFLSAFGGTILFVLICVGVHLAVGEKMPPATEKLIGGLFDMAKIGFGTIVGLLGGKALQGR